MRPGREVDIGHLYDAIARALLAVAVLCGCKLAAPPQRSSARQGDHEITIGQAHCSQRDLRPGNSHGRTRIRFNLREALDCTHTRTRTFPREWVRCGPRLEFWTFSAGLILTMLNRSNAHSTIAIVLEARRSRCPLKRATVKASNAQPCIRAQCKEDAACMMQSSDAWPMEPHSDTYGHIC